MGKVRSARIGRFGGELTAHTTVAADKEFVAVANTYDKLSKLSLTDSFILCKYGNLLRIKLAAGSIFPGQLY
ncbi:MAG: hypothetical protein KDE53_32500 [Caldilineaceae bacterium]|nr:hypothetical protein [Caldilineaceae bacterium]MCB0122348.1 hypothetical protein [Caldilineaceae bacterium]